VTRILVIEDNRNLATGLRNNLEIEGYEVEIASDGTSGLALARTTQPDLIVLDLMLPGMDGYRVLRTLRDDGVDIPVLILSARGEETDKVLGFHLGADDYVAKPFGLLEPFPAPRYQDSVPDRPADASRAPLPPRRTRHQQAASTASWSPCSRAPLSSSAPPGSPPRSRRS